MRFSARAKFQVKRWGDCSRSYGAVSRPAANRWQAFQPASRMIVSAVKTMREMSSSTVSKR
jgi:hypothetical protein